MNIIHHFHVAMYSTAYESVKNVGQLPKGPLPRCSASRKSLLTTTVSGGAVRRLLLPGSWIHIRPKSHGPKGSKLFVVRSESFARS
jgi:hypothetical protein